MKTVAISKFKNHALKVVDQIAKSQERVIIAKRGKPLAEIIPYRSSDTHPTPGKLADVFVFEKDIVSPLGEEVWDACK